MFLTVLYKQCYGLSLGLNEFSLICELDTDGEIEEF